MEKRRKIRGDDPNLNKRKKGRNERQLDVDGKGYFWQLNGLIMKIRSPSGKSKNFDISDIVGYPILAESMASMLCTPYDIAKFIRENESKFA